ncbi:MAG: ABC transporter ATP-binding protein, partial [Anaerolineae bacterium]|nr:ABC transporter ATP-binding protein [Anaerolineae bacterium]
MIHVQGLSKWYGDKLALDNVSFNVGLGEVLGLLGLNGAGKSTAMNILTGYIGATSGAVTINGHDIFQEPREAKRVIGYLPERLAFYNDMRVREHLDFVCDLKKVKAGRREHVASICERVGIAHVTSRIIRNLSKGYKQRLGFAQALVGDPKVLILDEPMAGLDPSQIIEIRSLIQEIGKTSAVMMSSHVLSEIQAVCTRVVVLHNGRLLADDTPEHLGRAVRAGRRVIARIRGEPKQVQIALNRIPGLKPVEVLAQKEPDAYEYFIEGAQQQDIRADLFRALAKADLPL